MRIIGKIDFISDEMSVGITQRRKKYIMITEIEKKPPSSMVIDFLGIKVDILNGVNEGDIVEIEYSIQYHDHKGRIINNVKGHAIQTLMDIDNRC